MSDFAKPRKDSRPGIHAVHVDAAREMVKLHTRGRQPPSANQTAPIGTASQMTQETSSRAPFVSDATSVCIPAKGSKNCANPQCDHCGGVIIPSPASSYPIQDQPSISVNDWSIYTVKRPILNSAELDHLAETRFDFPLPEMIFGNNVVRLINEKTGEHIEFNALDALDSLDPDCKFKVSYHKEWLDSRTTKKEEEKRSADKPKDIGSLTENLDVMKPYDWTYSPNYRGTTNIHFTETEKSIPVARLLQPDPILFYDESILFEDELGDNGIAMFSTKIRVMPQVLLLLCRFFLRIDNVIFRVRDTRVYVDFVSNEVLREYREQEMAYDEVLRKCVGKTNDPKSLLRDAQWVSQNIPVVKQITERNTNTNTNTND